ncbi:hypothetical protein SLNSH_09185 [Alsobacter soli]|uniref:Uncharacterized protein n=1 Tax=Alsobacter soli TaxID=2109933 RepID=A0A2T1HUM1_9HYPH|nr:hypothetical protein [Alsobacter soli]PSC05362.1 hypothetical protein SLNSH_09185 [Alsobacter soli]
MKPLSPDLTLDELLTDPLVRALMRADGVNPAAAERELRAVRVRPTEIRRLASAEPHSLLADLRHLVTDCIHFNESTAAAAGRLRKAEQPW